MNDIGNGAPGRTRSGRTRETRSRLIAGTLRVLKANGLAGTSSRAIAAESGENLSAITYHFGSKDQLVSEALLEAIRHWVEPALAALRVEAHPAMRMIGAIQALQESFERARDLLPVYLEALIQARRTDSLRQGVDELIGELRGFLAEEIRDLKAMGFLRGWIDPDAMAVLVLAAGDGVALHAALDPGSVDHHAVASQAMQLLLAGTAPSVGGEPRDPRG